MGGSPPHARGKVLRRGCRFVVDGITPACAGKRKLGQLFRAGIQDHPRMRGEKPHVHRVRFYAVGSPPHARGKVTITRIPSGIFGITPACAGKREGSPAGFGYVEDHPRMRGEK